MTSERNPEGGFMNKYKKKKKKKKKKYGKSVPIETEYPTIENSEKVSSIREWKKGTTRIVGESMLAEIEEKRISGNRSVKVGIFSGATTYNMYDYVKPLL